MCYLLVISSSDNVEKKITIKKTYHLLTNWALKNTWLNKCSRLKNLSFLTYLKVVLNGYP